MKKNSLGDETVIIKADGSVEPFLPERLAASLMRAGAGAHTAEKIVSQIEKSIAPGSASKEIYARAFAMLRKEARPIAARYALRRALLEFGPSGHPFEDFVSHLFRVAGWNVDTRAVLQGKCVKHEVDMYASRGSEHLLAELKYHNDPGYKTDVKVALYVKARFEDIDSCDPAKQTCPVNRGMLVTNTKFTSEAIAYAECAGLELLGWSYPAGEGLLEKMSRAKVYPVTTLTTLSRSEKRLLVDSGVVAVDELRDRRDAFNALRISPERVGEIRAEADGLLNLPHPFEND